MLETAERLVVEDKEPALQQFLLLVGALRAICDTGRPAGAVLDSFLLRSLSVAGYAPSFEACARCGLEGPHRGLQPRCGRDALRALPGAGLGQPRGRDGAVLGALLAGEWGVVEASRAAAPP